MVTSPKIIFIVVGSLAAIVMLGLVAMYDMILVKTDAALIGIIASPVSIALGALISLLNNTRTNAAPPASLPLPQPDLPPAPVIVANPEPISVTETPPEPEKEKPKP